MGTGESHHESPEQIMAEFFHMLPNNYMDVGIDESLLMFSGTDSTDQLVGYSSDLQSQLADDLPAFIGKVGEMVGGFTPVPNAVGLGAFVLSMILQIAFGSIKGSGGNTKPSPADMLRRVFAEEKASEVRDLMDEYLKRYKMYLYDEQRLLQETERLEKQLSLQVTVLQNSIQVDKQISSRAVKYWVNGAVFHVQMLIHIARLRKRTGTGTQSLENAKIAAGNAADTYHRHMAEIYEQYKKYKLDSLSMKYYSPPFCPPTGCKPSCAIKETDIHFSDDFSAKKYCSLSKDSYVNYIFSHSKKNSDMLVYFGNLRHNIDILVNKNGDFQIEKQQRSAMANRSSCQCLTPAMCFWCHTHMTQKTAGGDTNKHTDTQMERVIEIPNPTPSGGPGK
ncbi:uncharacterized protein LOC134452220 [Engraulis encrasicolus]|uniref:uncharacterized protein LOC134452220 n=1 Tax=Engraulis encrasicolus TaxID=184585 RepID=UPI002FD5E8E1